mmetsp:Transcript_29929/g.79729  ORF Transcript_29929/g.79729 Transcript_29929/m.79729 type:complete len:266 (-) Transcript_29929:631-1428(-)
MCAQLSKDLLADTPSLSRRSLWFHAGVRLHGISLKGRQTPILRPETFQRGKLAESTSSQIRRQIAVRDVAHLHSRCDSCLHAIGSIFKDQNCTSVGRLVEQTCCQVENLGIRLRLRNLVACHDVMHQAKQLSMERCLEHEVSSMGRGGNRHGHGMLCQMPHESVNTRHQGGTSEEVVQQLLALGHEILWRDLAFETKVVDQDLGGFQRLHPHHLCLQLPRERFSPTTHYVLLRHGVRSLGVQEQTIHIEQHVRHRRCSHAAQHFS